MKTRIILIFILLLAFQQFSNAQLPSVVKVDGGKFHVQGLAFDKEKECFYFSFTSAFFKTDMEGNIIGSVCGINGHIGAMTFDPVGRKVYASLELKDDAIGRNISEKLGARSWTRDQSAFYVAEIDVDKINSIGMSQDEVMHLHLIEEACKDYKASVQVRDSILDHRFACSGIDGVTIAPAFGGKRPGERYLYVAYGIYGDTLRSDNDYNVLLCYKLNDIGGRLQHKYFIHTGNTTWGVQNLAFDKASGKMFLAVYNGSKKQWPNYDLYAVETSQTPFRGRLEGVPYLKGKVEQLSLSQDGIKDPSSGICGWNFKWGSTGLCPLGNGTFYISVNGNEGGSQFCKATLYHWTGDSLNPFEPIR